MNDFNLRADMDAVMDLLDLSAKDLAEEIGVTPMTVSRWRKKPEQATPAHLSAFYDFAFAKGIRLNKIKEQLFKEDCKKHSVILFHGAKTHIEGDISIRKSKRTNDFGPGFYCGESLEQSAMFVANYPSSSLYILEFNKTGSEHIELKVDRDWMLLIAYFRGKLTAYADHPIIRDLLSRLEGVDYLVAPIADNRMFQIIDSFIDGEITDIQCRHCLSATNLGKQYVFMTDRALEGLTVCCHCYLPAHEKQHYLEVKREESRIGDDKVKVARRTYRGQGRYIDEILT